MHYLKHPQSTASTTTRAFSNRRSSFDALDRIAAFVIATPIIIANRLLWN